MDEMAPNGDMIPYNQLQKREVQLQLWLPHLGLPACLKLIGALSE
jgi:hypothetical protein